MTPPRKLNMDAFWQTLEGRIARAEAQPRDKRRSRWTVAVSVGLGAVCVALLVVTGVATRRGSAEHVYVATAGQQLSVRLVDGTRVTLAPASRLVVPAGYTSGERTTRLVGEAFFSVVHNAAHPFAVRVGHARVTDVGTQFDVRGYAEDSAVRVAVAEGVVKVGQATLLAGDMAMISTQETTVTHGADIVACMGWRQGRLTFDGEPLVEVARELSRALNLTIIVPDSVFAAQRITASFNNESVSQVLEDLSGIVGGRYERSGQKIVIRPKERHVRGEPVAQQPPLTTVQAR